MDYVNTIKAVQSAILQKKSTRVNIKSRYHIHIGYYILIFTFKTVELVINRTLLNFSAFLFFVIKKLPLFCRTPLNCDCEAAWGVDGGMMALTNYDKRSVVC